MRIFKNKSFARFARRQEILDVDLCEAIRQIERGLIGADLGGGVIKQRIARQGAGKSGGFRTLILFRIREKAFSVHGYAKNETDNLRVDELVALKKLAASMLGYIDLELQKAIANGTLLEVNCDGQSEAIS